MRALVSALVLLMLASAAPAVAQLRLPAEGFADLVERLSPAVVNIATRQRVRDAEELPQFPRGSPLERFNEGLRGQAEVTSLGSGFIISPDGVVVTNSHVIELADEVEVMLQNGARFEAEVVGRDPATDIAVLRIRSRQPLPYVSFGDSDGARVGDIVLAIGNPFGLGGSLSVGVVSARNRNINQGRYDDFIQTDAAINRGNSGGPLFNTQGQVIGVNTAILSQTGASVGIGFATPTSIVAPVVQQLLDFGEIRRGWLGVRLANLDAAVAQRAGYRGEGGAVVTRITPGGPAASAGLRPGDIILRFDGRDVADSRALTRMIGETAVGSDAHIELLRDGRRMLLTVRIERLREGPAAARIADTEEPAPRRDGGPRAGRIFGIALSELDPSLRERYQIEPDVEGLVVLGVDVNSANDNVLRPGDVVQSIGAVRVDGINAVRALAGRAGINEHNFVVRIVRDGAVTYRRVRARA